MNPTLPAPDVLALVGAFVGAVLALTRTVFAAHRVTVERFVTFLEGAVARQEAANGDLRDGLDRLAASLREQTTILARLTPGVRSA